MAGLDPEDGNGSVDASTPVQQSAWQQWTSKPENNAALLQFGLAMLQPHSPGQTAIGAAANAVGEGGEAAGRVLNNQQAEDKADLLDEATRAKMAQEAQTGQAALINANAYKKGIENTIANPKGTSGALKVQADFRRWLAKPDDETGFTSDPVVGAISKQYPDIKTKADLLANPQALRAAQQLFAQQMTTEIPDAGAPDDSGVTPSPTVPPGVGSPRTIYDKNGKAYTWDGVKGHAPVPQ